MSKGWSVEVGNDRLGRISLPCNGGECGAKSAPISDREVVVAWGLAWGSVTSNSGHSLGWSPTSSPEDCTSYFIQNWGGLSGHGTTGDSDDRGSGGGACSVGGFLPGGSDICVRCDGLGIKALDLVRVGGVSRNTGVGPMFLGGAPLSRFQS